MSPRTFAPPPASASSAVLYITSFACFTLSALLIVLGALYVLVPALCAPTWPVSSFSSPFLHLCAGYVDPTHDQKQGQGGHYRYLVPLLVPVTAWFAIANWVGWEYFRYA